ncbi:MAG: hypothetical protein QM740_16785 [Acidovorax sp.]
MASATVFTQVRFWALVVFSVVLPCAVYVALLYRRSISRAAVLFFGLVLVFIAGVDVYLLQGLATAAKETPSLADNVVFVSELSTALYLLPALIGGIGVNIVSHVLIRHLFDAEKKFESSRPQR